LFQQFFTATDRLSPGDLVTNLVVYFPFGFIIALTIRCGTSAGTIVLTSIAGFCLSLTMETLQAFLPQRVPSTYDLSLNTVGTAVGATVATLVDGENAVRQRLRKLVATHCRHDRDAHLGLGVLALWVMSQLVPFIPSMDVSQIRGGYRAIWLLLNREATIDFPAALAALCCALTISAVACHVWLQQRDGMRKTVLLVLGTLLVKGLIVTRGTTLESLLSAAAGLAMFHFVGRPESLASRALGVLAAAATLLVEGVASGGDPSGTPRPFNWIPLLGHLQHPLTGLMDVVGGWWLPAAIAFLLLTPCRHRRWLVATGGLVLLTGMALSVEWLQQYQPGRVGDLTDVLLIAVAYLVSCGVLLRSPPGASASPAIQPTTLVDGDGAPDRRVWHSSLPALLSMVLLAGIVTWLVTCSVSTARPVSAIRIVAGGRVQTSITLKATHPRLPAPSPEDLNSIRQHNPEWLERQAERGQAPDSDLEAAVLSAYAAPGSIDLQALHGKLLALTFFERGNEQTKPLAMTYDWLYARWTPAERSALLAKTLDGCEWQIAVIRDQGMSPYNVFLYNSPLQALMACSIATWGDAPRAIPVMHYTAHYWRQRVLPVWRQVMGAHGGWHEGGEYVGIGIGQAVYQLPAMWRKATGEDLFVTEPGLRGFLDFLVYRQRPDGTYFRWGDAGYFDRNAPDRVPLALEYRHAAAYSLGGCPREVAPTAWPWGPLPDPSLCDESAASRLATSKLFDGIGMLIARSGWDPDGTQVSFKAGNNYWSHSHLDQGSFTIFKRGPLAIDSGVYGPGYGSDHHMNYTYQTIAHNALTVTDPDDVVPAPAPDQGRHIANDGGQRRIGSGWGVDAAPLDYDEWMVKGDTYRAGRILSHDSRPDYDAIVADLTAAYTNQSSGTGDFSSRTRRVRRYQRSFAYDRSFDTVIVYDRVQTENAKFPVRWLLHTSRKPSTGHHRFDVVLASRPDETQPGRAGMRGFAPLPFEQHIDVIGGPGAEFLVDGRNYDEQGAVQRQILQKQLDEVGEWRIELKPAEPGLAREFLVFLVPWVDAPPRDLDVHCVSEAGRYACTLTRDGRQMNYRVLRDSGRIERRPALSDTDVR